MAAECLACRGVPGERHTCPDSGTFLAAEAHDSGEIEATAQAWPNFQVTIHLHLRAPTEQEARTALTALMGVLLDDVYVSELDFALELAEIEVPS